MTDELPRRRGRPPKSSYHASAPGYQMQRQDDEATANLEGSTESVAADQGGPALPGAENPADAIGDDAAPEEEIAESGPLVPTAGWFGMDIAPEDGRPVVVAGLVSPGIPLSTPATMHHSRRWTGSVTRWVPFHEWRILNSPDRLPFEPLCWTRYE